MVAVVEQGAGGMGRGRTRGDAAPPRPGARRTPSSTWWGLMASRHISPYPAPTPAPGALPASPGVWGARGGGGGGPPRARRGGEAPPGPRLGRGGGQGGGGPQGAAAPLLLRRGRRTRPALPCHRPQAPPGRAAAGPRRRRCRCAAPCWSAAICRTLTCGARSGRSGAATLPAPSPSSWGRTGGLEPRLEEHGVVGAPGDPQVRRGRPLAGPRQPDVCDRGGPGHGGGGPRHGGGGGPGESLKEDFPRELSRWPQEEEVM